MKTGRVAGWTLALIASTAIAAAQTKQAAPKRAAASSQEPITLSVADLYPGKTELLNQAREMQAEAATTRDTVEYAARHKRFLRAVSVVKPPISQWNASERELIASVPAPTDEAKKKYEAEQRASEAEIDRRIEERERSYIQEQELRARQNERDERIRQQRVGEAQRWAEVDALHRQAEALENRYPYYGPVFVHPPKKVKPTPKGSPTPKVTPPPGPGIIPW